jgi:ATP-binding cassette, subfamily B, bacterial
MSPWYAIWQMIRYRPLQWSLYAAMWLLFHTLPLASGLLVRAFWNALDGRGPAGLSPLGLAALIMAAGLARGAAFWGGSAAGVPYLFPVRAWLQRNLLSRLFERLGARALPGTVGEAISTLRDDTQGMAGLSDWAFDALAGALFACGGLAILLTVDSQVTLLVFLPLAVVIGLAQAVRTRLVRYREESREAAARLTGALGESFGGVQAVQVAGKAPHVVAHLQGLADRRRQAVLRERWQGLWLDALFQNTASMGAALVLLAVAGRMREGSFSVGDFALFATYLLQVADFTGFLGYLINAYRQGRVHLRRAEAFLQGAPAERLVARPGRTPAIATPVPHNSFEQLSLLEVTGLTCRHPASGHGIFDISFTLRRGTLTVVTGRVGAGKTTLLRALLGLLEADAGEIRWNGRPVERPADFLVPPRAAYTAQAPVLLPGTIQENILLGVADTDGRLKTAVHAAVLEEEMAGWSDGLDTVLGARGMRLSGGQIQRVAAARMLARQADLLVCDDLSSALDAQTEQELWDRVLATGATCLTVSHRPALLARADQVLTLEDGRICRWCSGRPDAAS